LAALLRWAIADFGHAAGTQGLPAPAKLPSAPLSEFRPGTIRLDYHLPDMNGFEAIKAIRAEHCFGCVLMTAHPADTVVADAEQHRIAHILAKPFPLAGLESTLWATASQFCAKCFQNGQQPSRPECGGFVPPKSPSMRGNFPKP